MSRRSADGTYISTTQQGYGYQHQQLRRVWAARVKAGEVSCGKCGKLIHPNAPFDLGHPWDRKDLPPAPWHRSCNRSYAASITKKRRQAERAGAAIPAAQPPMKWSRWWASPPPQGCIVGRDPRVYYPGDPWPGAQPAAPTVVSLDDEVEKLQAKQQPEPPSPAEPSPPTGQQERQSPESVPGQQRSIPLTEFYRL
jgi:hypothetical protein